VARDGARGVGGERTGAGTFSSTDSEAEACRLRGWGEFLDADDCVGKPTKLLKVAVKVNSVTVVVILVMAQVWEQAGSLHGV